MSAYPVASALVIGNTDGIGLALTRRLLERGVRVLGISRRESPIQDPRYRHLHLDVTDPAYRERLPAFLRAEPAPVELCVYAAGIGELFSRQDLTREGRVFRVNLLGAVETLEVLLPIFVAARAGHFIGLSSLGDETRSGQAPAYVASKAGLSAYLVSLGLALAPDGIAITNLRLGFVDTKMAKASVRPFMISVERAVDVIERAIAERPLQVSHPKIMAALVWLARQLGAPGIWLRRAPRPG